MAYKALYRTYRPSSFEEVAGQKHIVKTLKNALATNKIAHAYLFCGPRGTGKTSMAKLLAKALNCEEGLGHQCNHCSNCLAVSDGSHPDVIEIDAASNNGVDEVRDLIEKVKYSPIKGRYKVYIIDEVHMMTSGAFNALLKTLEEPPAHVVFILATTEAHKVLPTIVSRCQRYDFSKVDDEDIIKRLKEIFAKENISYEEDALKSITTLADGGVRDALSIADQVIAYSGSNISEKDVEDLFGLASIEEKVDFLNNINEQNTKYVLEKMNKFIEAGVDIKRLTTDMLDILKDVIIYKNTTDVSLLVKLKENQVKDFSNKIANKKVLEMINILLDAQSNYKFVNNIRTLFEITLLKLLNISSTTDANNEPIKSTNESSLNSTSKETKVEEKQVQTNINSVPTQPVAKQNETSTKILDDNNSLNQIQVATMGERNQLTQDDLIKIMVTGNKEMKMALISKWKSLEDYKLHPTLGKFATLLLNGKPYVMNEKVLVLDYQFANEAEKVNLIANQNKLCEVVKLISGVQTKIYALSRNESYDASRTFMELRQLSKLPDIKVENIEINIKGE